MSDTAPNPVAFITGGSSGIGLALARLVVGRGYDVALFARDRERLEAARSNLSGGAGAQKIRTFATDVADDSFPDVLERAVTELGVPDLAIASAGIAVPGRFLEQDMAQHRRHMDVNYFGSLTLARTLAPRMVARGTGHIAFLSSAAGLAGIYGFSGYGASKFAVRGLAEALSLELAGTGVGVTICYPPDTETPMLAAEIPLRPDETTAIAAKGGVLSPEEVARATLRGIDRGRFVVAPGLPTLGLALAGSVTIPFFRRLQRRVVSRLRKQD